MLEKFRFWRQAIMDQKHKQKIIKRSLEHCRRHKFEIIARAFKKMVNRQRMAEGRETLAQKAKEQADLVHNKDVERMTHEENKLRHSALLQDISDSISLRKNSQAKLMAIMERRNKEWLFISKKRQIFEALRDAGKKHNAFCLCVGKMLEKSMLLKGFTYIQEASKATDYTNKVHRNMRLLAIKSGRYNMLDAFNKWKLYSLAKVDERIDAATKYMDEKNQEFNEYVKTVKRQNMARVFALF